MICPRCQKTIHDGAVFCSHCGDRLPAVRPAATLPARKATTLASFLLSVFSPGLGHVYIGQPSRGYVMAFLVLGVFFLPGFLGVWKNGTGFVLWIALFVCFYLFNIVDAVLRAKKPKKYPAQRKDHWYHYVVIPTLFFAAFFSILFSLVKFPFFIRQVVTGAMEPTILIGDNLAVQKGIPDGISIARGTILAFKQPENNSIVIKRVIAFPGEAIKISNNQLEVNGSPVAEPYAVYSNMDGFLGNFPQEGDQPFLVPAGHYFFLGDNRQNSFDSRHYGPVPREAIVGRPLYVLWSAASDREEYLMRRNKIREFLGNFSGKIRWGRILKKIE